MDRTNLIHGSRARGFRLAALAILLSPMLALTGCSKSSSLFRPSIADQKQAGAEGAKQVAQQYRLVSGSQLDRVQAVGRKLEDALPADQRTTWDWNFHVIDSKEINAFALPGGNVYIFTGLLDRIQNDNELAAVLGHEMTHVREQHWANEVAADQERSAGLSVLLAAVKAGSGAYTAAGALNTLVNLRYSRKEEDQADAGGLDNMVAAGYDPNGMLQLFDILQSATSGGNVPAFLQDHPLTSDRIKHTQERIAKLKAEGKA